MKKILMVLMAVVTTMTIQAKQWTTNEVEDVIRKVNTYWQTNNPAEVRAFWDNAAYHTGNMEVYRLLKDKQMLDYSIRWAKHNHWKGATEADPAKWKYKQYGEGQDYVLFGDWQICFQTYIDLYNLIPAKKKVARAKEVMGYEADSKANDYWWWADALYMVMPVMTKMYKLTGDEKYLDKLYANICYSDSIMLDSETGLYFRDGKYVYPKHKTASGKKDFWARGDGWVLAGLAKVLQDMPKTYRHQPFFAEKFMNLAQAVKKLQQPEGHWTRSMMDPEQAPGYETSGTAFFCYGLLWGVNNGILPKKAFEPAIEKAWNYLTSIALQSDGKVGYVQPIGERAIPGQTVDGNSQANFGVGAFLLAACEYKRFIDASKMTLTFSNPGNQLRQEVVETDLQAICQQLGISTDEPLVVENAVGQEVGYQKTYDGKLLLYLSLQPHGKATYIVSKGKPAIPKRYVDGRMYSIRKDDIAWENDLGIYRVYGPALQKTGERSFGTDVWVKNTPELVAENRYLVDYYGNAEEDSLKKAGQKVALGEIDQRTSFHLDHGNGMDAYGVGPSLGCGAPALMKNGKLVFPYCYQSYQIHDNGPLRFTVELTYAPNADGITEHRLISLDRGSHFNRITVWYDGIKQPMALASGVVLHGDDNLVLGKNYVQYADPTDNPKLHQSQIYVATLYPEGVSETCKLDGELNHGLGIVRNYLGAPYTYYFGSAWSLYDIRSQAQWQLTIDEFLSNLQQPLTLQSRGQVHDWVADHNQATCPLDCHDREYWCALAYKMAQPVLENMAKGELQKNMKTEFSPSFDNRDRSVVYMETFGRLMAGIAPWLSLPDDDTAEGQQRKQLREWALAAYKNAVDPNSPDYLCWGKAGQNLVDAAYIAESFLRAWDALWLPLDETTRQRYIKEFQNLRHIDPPYTNWFLFSSTIESLLAKAKAPFDEFRVNTACRKVEEWYVGDGWYADGPVFAFDYYSSYVFHAMYLETLQAMVDSRYNSRLDYQKYYDRALKRAQKFAIILERFISPEGTFPVIGRSTPYRLAAMQPLALMAWYQKLPSDLSNGQVRAALTKVMHRMFDKQENFNDAGYLTIGFCGSQPETADWYTNNGSLYMTSLAFMPLGLPASHPFWTDAPQPWTQVKAWGGQPFPKDHRWADDIQTRDKW